MRNVMSLARGLSSGRDPKGSQVGPTSRLRRAVCPGGMMTYMFANQGTPVAFIMLECLESLCFPNRSLLHAWNTFNTHLDSLVPSDEVSNKIGIY